MVDNMYRVVVVGSGGVGKSALTIQYIQKHFVDEYDPTIEDSYRRQTLVDEQTALIDILDTAGQEEYSSMRDQYLLTGEGFIVVYSLISYQTFSEVSGFINSIYRIKDTNIFPIILVGNKCDLENKREVSYKEGVELAKNLNIDFYETSAKNNKNVEEVFHGIIRIIRKNRQPIVKLSHKKNCVLL